MTSSSWLGSGPGYNSETHCLKSAQAEV